MRATLPITVVAPTTPVASRRRACVIADRERQSVHQIRDRVWKAKLRRVERIEDEEDQMWGILAERSLADANGEFIPWQEVRRKSGLDRPD